MISNEEINAARPTVRIEERQACDALEEEDGNSCVVNRQKFTAKLGPRMGVCPASILSYCIS